jgi:hypothetical protein
MRQCAINWQHNTTSVWSGMGKHRDTEPVAHFIQRTDMIGMGMGQEKSDWCRTVEHCYQFVWLCPWIDQDTVPGQWADQRITVHGPGTDGSHA